jgi:hypothetical protein
MSEFEDELRAALRRQEPPAGFEDRVLAAARPSRLWQKFQRHRMTGEIACPTRTSWIAAAIAAGLLLSLGGFGYREYEGRKAKRELLLALEIAGSKLSIAQEKISHLSQRTIHE